MKLIVLCLMSVFLFSCVEQQEQGEIQFDANGNVQFDNGQGQGQACVRVTPSISANLLEIDANAGSSLAYSLTLQDNNIGL